MQPASFGLMDVRRSVEKGNEILPPFDTVLGRVGLSICFDVGSRRLVISSSKKRKCLWHNFTATLP